jgi:polyhydroxyalkanoate synthesis regulator phasin
MSELISKALLSGLGLASLTKNAVQQTIEDLSKKSSLSEEEGKRLVKELHRRSSKAHKRLEKTVQTAVNRLLKEINMEVVRTGKRPAKAPKRTAGAGRRRSSVSKAKSR